MFGCKGEARWLPRVWKKESALVDALPGFDLILLLVATARLAAFAPDFGHMFAVA